MDDKIARARALRTLILEHRGETDTARRLAQPVVEALAELGVFRSMVPRAAGGEEWDLPTAMRVVEALSTADGAVGWVAGVGGAVNAVCSGWLSTEAARALIAGDAIGLCAGSGVRYGKARRVDGGYRLTGRWLFASSAPHASWFLAGYNLDGADPPLEGMPMVYLPARDVTLVDTWHVGGMRGTGSQDFGVEDAFVPDDYLVNPITDPPRHDGPLYRLPVPMTLGSGLGPLALGMARGALDCFTELMASKRDRRTGVSLGDRLTVQERLARAEAAVRSARAFLYEAAEEVWGTASAVGQVSDRQVALFRLANMNAVASGAQAIDLVYHAAGTSGIFESSLLERFFRDVHVATQHRHGSPEEMWQIGEFLLNEARS
jgi:alkylation response protein AidB-like acyl-CoA dehydrogenase